MSDAQSRPILLTISALGPEKKFELANRNRIVLPLYLRAGLLERVRGAVNRAFVEMFCDQHHADW